ncbi:hypothetical protein [Halorussus salinus]|uniref:hypothetical protein n=1 Tax=Halorussus salinus TaxID=1364935 RepID=UPI00138F59CD|nr:hypothetical protein [Halorussus salinus]
MKNLRTAVVGLVVAVVVVSGTVSPVVGTEPVAAPLEAESVAASAGGVTVQPSPETTSVTTGETTTVTITASSVTAGVGAYNLSVGLGNSSVARIEEVSLAGGPEGTQIDSNADDSSVRAIAYGVDTAQTGTVEIARVTLVGEAVGESDVTVGVEVIGDESGNEYAPVAVSSGRLSVTADRSTTAETTATTTAATTSTTTASSGGGGGGGGAGGGGGGGANVPPPPVQFTEERTDSGVRFDVRNVRPETRLDASVEEFGVGGLTVEHVRFEFTGESAHALFELRGASESPAGIPAPPGEELLGHVTVETRYASPSVVGEARYRFHLPASALPTGATLSEVAVYRYADGSWTEVGVERDGATFTATTEGFSPFAVVLDPTADQSSDPTTAGTTAAADEASASENATTATADESPRATTADADGDVPGFGLGATLVALVTAGLAVLRRHRP